MLLKHIFDNPNNLKSMIFSVGKLFSILNSFPNGTDFLFVWLKYLSITDVSLDNVRKVLIENLSEKGDNLAMTLAETLERKGEERGIEKGKEIGKEIGEKIGKEIGRIESKTEMAEKMLKKGLDVQFISEVSELSIEDIEKLNPNI